MALSTIGPSGLNDTIVSGKTELAAIPATTDELLISDAGTIKRIDAQFFQNTPAFSARMSSAQTISNETFTKADFDTEIFDTDGAYDHSTNQRFTVPTGKGGKYFFYAQAICDAGSAAQLQNCQITFYKNGSQFKKNTWNFNSNDIYYAGMQVSAVLDLSASDYIEVYVRNSDASGSPVIDGSGSTSTEFSGYKIIGA